MGDLREVKCAPESTVDQRPPSSEAPPSLAAEKRSGWLLTRLADLKSVAGSVPPPVSCCQAPPLSAEKKRPVLVPMSRGRTGCDCGSGPAASIATQLLPAPAPA